MEKFEYCFESTVYVHTKGALDSLTSKPFVDELSKRMEHADEPLYILDMQDVDFMNSLGLAAIIKLWKTAQVHNRTLRILTNPRIANIFRVSHLDTIIDLYVMERLQQSNE